ncbi:putative NAD-dependent epimerase/dehydratase domain-containing protein [Seiridium cardinale]|uniref:NAD-dependent epimerase/dehydratase domain-containing protein n=1 Tax=Seiridium cardinale TaxID=138064 RepID=A0ABR2XXW2_9PEZI
MIVLDGTTLEGGGGLVRSAITFSSLLNKPIRIRNVRALRPEFQGLRPGHNTAIEAMRQFTGAFVQGNHAWNRELQFVPHANADTILEMPQWTMDTSVEGSASIFLIAIVQYLLFSKLASSTFDFKLPFKGDTEIKLTIRAGMLCQAAPSIFYMRQVFIPILRLIGIREENLHFTSEYEEGWWNERINKPGKVVAIVKPLAKPLTGFIFKRRGQIQLIQVTAHVPSQVRDKFQEILEVEMANAIFTDSCGIQVRINVFGCLPEDQYHILMTATTLSPTAYLGYELIYPQEKLFPTDIKGDEEKTASYITRACIRGLWKELSHGNAVDEHMEDILAMYQSVACGFSSVITTKNQIPVMGFSMDSAALGPNGYVYDVNTGSIHRETSWWLAEQMAGVRLEEKDDDGCKRVGCYGLGLGKPAEIVAGTIKLLLSVAYFAKRGFASFGVCHFIATEAGAYGTQDISQRTGGTGYIGGSVLDALVSQHPEYDVTVLLRNIPSAFRDTYPKVCIVEGEFDDTELISATAAVSDIVIHNGNSSHEPSIRAHIAGLLRTATSNSPRYLLRLGGTSSIADWADPTYYGERNPKVWSDVDDIDTLKSLPDTALHRSIEKIIEVTAADHGDRLKCAIICSCGVYGPGRGLGNTQSGLVPMYWSEIRKKGHAFYTKSGGNTRSWVHIDDLTQLYLKLLEAAVAGGGTADWGREVGISMTIADKSRSSQGYYFTATQEWPQLDLAQATGKILKKHDIISNEEPIQLPLEEIREMRGKSKFSHYGIYVYACSTRTKSDRARKVLGYQPRSPNLWHCLEDDLMAAVEG